VALDLPVLLIQLIVLVAGAALARVVMARLGQPTVLGDLLVGIALGPTLLGRLAPDTRTSLFPEENAVVLEALGSIGLILFVYLAGSEMRWRRTELAPAAWVATGGFVVPFTLGTALALWRPSWFFDGPPDVRRVGLVAVIMTVSALMVLARILEDVRLHDHAIGTITMGAGTLDDTLGWIVLGLVAGTGALGLTGNLAPNLAILALLVLLLALLDRALPSLLGGRLATAFGRPGLFVMLLVGLFASAWITHEAGVHAVLGPLAVGALMSRHPPLRAYAARRLGDITRVLLLPIFFVLTGAEVDLALLGDRTALVALVVTFLVASLGKVLGVYVGGRAADLTPRAALVAGILLNARGAVGLVAARVGYDAGLLNAAGYALLVVIVVLTTLAAPPAVHAYARHLARSRGRSGASKKPI
jgi:Kef-type K+ transport system membrane component KefB